MSRNLWILNLLLMALAGFAGREFRNCWLAGKNRERALLSHHLDAMFVPRFRATPMIPTLTPAGYARIAQEDLFDASRSAEVIVEKVPVPPPPQPPPLPLFYGEMDLGDGPMAILSENPNAHQHATRPGEMIGPFRLTDITRQDLTLEWEGQVLRLSLDGLRNRDGAMPNGAMPTETARAGQTNVVSPLQAQQTPAASVIGLGTTANASRICAPDDGTHVGTDQEGFRKTQMQTPFGQACFWDRVSK